MNGRAEGVAPRTAAGLKRRSIILMIVLTLVTLGVYPCIWFLRTRRGLNSLNTETKIGLVPILAFSLLQLIMLFARLAGLNSEPTELILRLLNLVFWLTLSFRIKGLLEEHLASPSLGEADLGGIMRASADLSGVLTFFFAIYYLQHVINTRVLRGTPVDSYERPESTAGASTRRRRLWIFATGVLVGITILVVFFTLAWLLHDSPAYAWVGRFLNVLFVVLNPLFSAFQLAVLRAFPAPQRAARVALGVALIATFLGWWWLVAVVVDHVLTRRQAHQRA